MAFIRKILAGLGIATLLYSTALAATPEEVNKVIAELKAKGKQSEFVTDGQETTRYEKALEDIVVEGKEYDYVRINYVPLEENGTFSVALLERDIIMYDVHIIYDGSATTKPDGTPDKILKGKFSVPELLEMRDSDACLKDYEHSEPDQESRKLFDYFVKVE